MSQRSGFGSAISRRNSLDVSHLSSVNSKSFGAKTVGKSSRRKTFNAIPDLEEGSFLTEDSSFISSTNDENDESMFNASNCNTSEHSIPSRPSTGGGSKRRWSHRSTDQSPMSLKSPMQLRSAEKSKVASDAKSVSSRNSVRSSNSNSTKASKKDSAESTSATKSDHGSLSSVRSKLSNARSMASGADNRRQTFDGGQQALNMLLDTSDSTDLGAAALAAARESRSRRATVDPSDLDEMMKELEDDSDSMRLSVSSGANFI